MTGEQLVGGRYLLGAALGRGGMAEVHRAADQRLGREVAVKRLSAHLAADPTAQTRFGREALAAASLNHPAIASVFDTGEDTDPGTGISIPYIVMELVEGQTLRAVLGDGVPLPPERALQITSSVLDALAHSHAAGIIHRDIKPANVMLTPAGAVKVMDFGIARAVDDTAPGLTQTAAVIGTAQYLSPEQASGRSVDQRSDLYAVGCLLYELLVGRPPFVGESSISVAYQHVREEPIPPSTLNPALSPALDTLVLHALAKDPDERYASADAMRADVALLLADPAHPALSGPAGATTRLRPAVPAPETVPTAAVVTAPPAVAAAAEPRRSGAARALLVALGVFLLLGLGAFGLFRAFSPVTSPSVAVTVPPVIGSTRAEAEAALRGVDLLPRFEDVRSSDDDSRGTVVEQTPLGGNEVAAGSVVTLQVNVSPDEARIPDGLVGDYVSEVRDELAAAGFTSVRALEVPSPTTDDEQGEVVSLDPGEGESVSLDEDIVLRYASGTRAGGGGGDSSGDSSGSGSGGGDGATSRPDDEDDDDAAPAPSRSSEPSAPEQTDEPSEPGEEPSEDDPTTTAPAPSPSSSRSSEPTPTAGSRSTSPRTTSPRNTKDPQDSKVKKTKDPKDPRDDTNPDARAPETVARP